MWGEASAGRRRVDTTTAKLRRRCDRVCCEQETAGIARRLLGGRLLAPPASPTRGRAPHQSTTCSRSATVGVETRRCVRHPEGRDGDSRTYQLGRCPTPPAVAHHWSPPRPARHRCCQSSTHWADPTAPANVETRKCGHAHAHTSAVWTRHRSAIIRPGAVGGANVR